MTIPFPLFPLPQVIEYGCYNVPPPDFMLSRISSTEGMVFKTLAFSPSPGRVVVQKVGSPGLALVIWIIGGLLAMTGALCYIELGCAIPESGGEFAYLKAAYGDAVAFLFTWNCALVAKPASCRYDKPYIVLSWPSLFEQTAQLESQSRVALIFLPPTYLVLSIVSRRLWLYQILRG